MQDIESMKNQFASNANTPIEGEIKCAYCGADLIKTTRSRQFCNRTGNRNCKDLYHRAMHGIQPDPSRTGQEPKMTLEHRSSVLKDLKTMSKTAVAAKYGVHRTTLYDALRRWQVAAPDRKPKLSYEDEMHIIEMRKTMTAQQVADAMDVSRSTINRIVAGEEPREQMIDQLGMLVATVRDLRDGRVNYRRKTLLCRNKQPIFVMVPIDEWLREHG